MDNYEEKYKAALGWMQSLYGGLHGATKEEAEKYFPELKESEDERIRKKVIEVLKLNIKGAESQMQASRGVDRCFEIYACNKVIAWLEKQGEQKPYGQRKECEDCQFNYAGECKGSCTLKRNEHKPTDKVEPKFHPGDWIIDNEYVEVLKVTKSDANSYEITNQDGEVFDILKEDVECNHRLWTFEDAKDGDVLVDEDNNIGLYREEKDDLYWHSYIYIGCDNCFRGFGGYHNYENTKPATKEQRDLLFQKMTDAGYEFVNGHITRF